MKRCFPGLGSHMKASPPYFDGARVKSTCILPIGTCFVHCRTKKNHFHFKSGLNAVFFYAQNSFFNCLFGRYKYSGGGWGAEYLGYMVEIFRGGGGIFRL